MKALVIFCDDDSHPLSFMLRKGFRHCFVCLEDNGLWFLLDGGPGVPRIKYLTTSDFDLIKFYRDQGMTVIETSQRDKPVLSPFILRNCTGMVKAVLCIRSLSVTPYQLYQFLRSKHVTWI